MVCCFLAYVIAICCGPTPCATIVYCGSLSCSDAASYGSLLCVVVV
jgi:hypothetical protein